MNKSRYIIVAIISILLIGCSKQTDKATTAQETTAVTEAETTTAAMQESETETEAETKEDTDKNTVSLSTSYYNDYKYDDTNMIELYKISAQKIYVNDSDGYEENKLMKSDVPGLANALEEYSANEEQNAKDWVEPFLEGIKAQTEDMDIEYFSTYEFKSEAFVQRADAKVLSILNQNYVFQGGVHGSYYSIGYNYDTQTGQTIELEDVVTDMSALSDILREKLNERYEGGLFGDPRDTINDMIRNKNLYFTLGYEGIVCYFNEYDVGPFSTGMIPVEVGFAEYPELFDDKYLSTADSYTFQLPFYNRFYYDLDGDGDEEVILLSHDYDEYGTINLFELSVDDKLVSAETYCYTSYPTFIHMEDGRNYIYLDCGEDNDYESTAILEVSKDPKFITETYNLGIMGYSVLNLEEYRTMVITDPSRFPMQSRSDLLSTFTVYKSYTVGDDGLPSAKDTEYQLAYQPFKITSKVPLTLKDMNGTETTIPAGSVYEVLSTDNKTYATVSVDSKTYILPVEVGTDNNWYRKVNGIDIEEAFDGIVFAG